MEGGGGREREREEEEEEDGGRWVGTWTGEVGVAVWLLDRHGRGRAGGRVCDNNGLLGCNQTPKVRVGAMDQVMTAAALGLIEAPSPPRRPTELCVCDLVVKQDKTKQNPGTAAAAGWGGGGGLATWRWCWAAHTAAAEPPCVCVVVPPGQADQPTDINNKGQGLDLYPIAARKQIRSG